eukprot:73904_1
MSLAMVDYLLQQFDDKSTNNSSINEEKSNATKHFAMPSMCCVQPQLVNITLEEVMNWRSIGVTKPHSAAHVAILYMANGTLYVAWHQRSHELRNGKGKLGWPGGIADHANATIVENTIRELKEECFAHTNITEIEKHLHLLYAKKISDNPMQMYAQFVLFVDDVSLLTGPDEDNEWEVSENHAFGMTKSNGYHNFFSWKWDSYTNCLYLNDSIHKINANQYRKATHKIWSKRALITLYYCVETKSSARWCRWHGSVAGCRKGKSCKYSHDNPNSVQLCRNPDNCHYGNNCRYRHE